MKLCIDYQFKKNIKLCILNLKQNEQTGYVAHYN